MELVEKCIRFKKLRVNAYKETEKNIIYKHSRYLAKKRIEDFFKNHDFYAYSLANQYEIPVDRIYRLFESLKTREFSVIKKDLEFISNYRKQYGLHQIYLDIIANQYDIFPTINLAKRLGVLSIHHIKNFIPLTIRNYGSIDPGILDEFSIEDLVIKNNIIVELECIYLERLTKKQNKIAKGVAIIDLAGLSISKIMGGRFIDLIKRIINTNTNYVKETTEKVYVINVPFTFYMLWKIISGLIPKDVIEKIEILNYNGHDKISKYFLASELPIKNGGKCDCEKNKCYEKVLDTNF